MRTPADRKSDQDQRNGEVQSDVSPADEELPITSHDSIPTANRRGHANQLVERSFSLSAAGAAARPWYCRTDSFIVPSPLTIVSLPEKYAT